MSVGVGDGLADLLEDGDQASTVGPVFQQLLERPALDELHGQERPAVGQPAEDVGGRDCRVLELPGNAGFFGKPMGRTGVLVELVVENLDRDFPTEGVVRSPVDDAHAAPAHLLQQLMVPQVKAPGAVRAGRAAVKSGVRRGHRLRASR